MSVGNLIKVKRKELNMTQGELAENISTQAMISKIENESLNPSTKTLEKIALKLKEPVSYFYGEKNIDQDQSLDKVENELRHFLNKNEYGQADNVLKANYHLFKKTENDYFKQFFTWVEVVLMYFQEKDSIQAINLLENLLNNIPSQSSIYFDVLSSLAILHYESGNHNSANSHFEVAFNKMDESTHYKVKIRTLYNYALNLDSLDRSKSAIEMTLQAIEIAISEETLYMLGYLYFLKAYLLRKKKIYNEALEAFSNAEFVFKITGFQKMLTLTKIEIKEVIDLENPN